MAKLLFVYGTLKQDQCRANVLKGQKFIGFATTAEGFGLFDLGPYPAMKKTPAGIAKGELWEVNDNLIPTLDAIEGSPFLYKLEPVQLTSHPDLKVEAYLFQRQLPKVAQIETWPLKI